MAILFSLSGGDISTIGSLNSGGPVVNSTGTGNGYTLSANKPLLLPAGSNSVLLNTPIYGIALCLSTVGITAPSDTIKIQLGTNSFTYAATGLSQGLYVNSYVKNSTEALVGWVLFKFPNPITFTIVPNLCVFGTDNKISIYGTTNNTVNYNIANIMVYGIYNANVTNNDIIYLTKNLNTDGSVKKITTTGSFSAIKQVYVCDGVTSKNNFDFWNWAKPNSLYIAKGGVFTGKATMTGRGFENYIHVLNDGVLSADFALPTYTGRIKAIDGAIVNLKNVYGWGMQYPNIYNYLTDPKFNFDYLHEITNGYALFDNCTFWSGISCGNVIKSVSNLSAINSKFKQTYKFYTGTSTLEISSNTFFKVGNNCIANNVLLANLSCDNDTTLNDGNFNNFEFKNTNILKGLNIFDSNFSNSKISNITFSDPRHFDSITLSGNDSLPIFENIKIYNRLGIIKYDSCPIIINGLSCLSARNFCLSASDLGGKLNDLYIKDSNHYYEFIFNSSSFGLEINGLSTVRTPCNPIKLNSSKGYSLVTTESPSGWPNSILLTTINDFVSADIAKIIDSDTDDYTMEIWYKPLNTKLGYSQNLIGLWSSQGQYNLQDPTKPQPIPATTQTALIITSAGFVDAIKHVYDTTTNSYSLTTIVKSAMPYGLINNNWYHVCLTKNKKKYTIYINGLKVSENTDTGVFSYVLGKYTPKEHTCFIGPIPGPNTLGGSFGPKINPLSGFVAGAKISYGVLYDEEFVPPYTPFITEGGTIFNLTTTFSAEYSNMPLSFLNIKDNESSNSVSLNKLKFISNGTLSSNLIDISNSSYEKFSINNSDLSTHGKPLILDTRKDSMAGSFILNKCNFINDPFNVNNILGYQSYTYREIGFAVQCGNNDINNNYRWTRGGKVSLDTSTIYYGNPTEKLESISDEFVLKSNIKYIPVSETSTISSIKLTYKTLPNYVSGACVKIEKNSILGIEKDYILKKLPPTNNTWYTVLIPLSSFNNPNWKQKSFIVTYVELIGNNNTMNIAKWLTSNDNYLYFWGTTPSNGNFLWSEITNWYSDSAHTTQAASLPISSSDVIVLSTDNVLIDLDAQGYVNVNSIQAYDSTMVVYSNLSVNFVASVNLDATSTITFSGNATNNK